MTIPFKIGECVKHVRNKEQKMYISNIQRRATPQGPIFGMPEIKDTGKVKCKYTDKDGINQEDIFNYLELTPWCE